MPMLDEGTIGFFRRMDFQSVPANPDGLEIHPTENGRGKPHVSRNAGMKTMRRTILGLVALWCCAGLAHGQVTEGVRPPAGTTGFAPATPSLATPGTPQFVLPASAAAPPAAVAQKP